MMKKLVFLLLIGFGSIVLFSFKNESPAQTARPALRTIIIDAGHGGEDVGARGDYSFEKDICLDVALKLGKKMEAAFPDVKVLYTRTMCIPRLRPVPILQMPTKVIFLFPFT
jgi:N-acetylmuramoyl-L-alanine amidase